MQQTTLELYAKAIFEKQEELHELKQRKADTKEEAHHNRRVRKIVRKEIWKLEENAELAEVSQSELLNRIAELEEAN